jgi:hypothetical protein
MAPGLGFAADLTLENVDFVEADRRSILPVHRQ